MEPSNKIMHIPENRRKRPVTVIAEIDEKGNQRPLRVKWEDYEYVIDRVLRIQPRFQFADTLADCYQVEINGHISYLFLEGKRRWFVGEKCDQVLGYGV